MFPMSDASPILTSEPAIADNPRCGVTAVALYERISVQNRRFRSNGGWPKISGRRDRPQPTILLLRKLG